MIKPARAPSKAIREELVRFGHFVPFTGNRILEDPISWFTKYESRKPMRDSEKNAYPHLL